MKTYDAQEAPWLKGRVLAYGAEGPRIEICTLYLVDFSSKILLLKFKKLEVQKVQGQKYHITCVVHLGKALYSHLLHSTQVN